MNKWILFKGYDRRNPFTLLDTADPKSWKVDYSIKIDDFDSPIYYKWNKKTGCFNYLFEVPETWLTTLRVIKVNTFTGAITFNPDIKEFKSDVQCFIKETFNKATNKQFCFVQTKYTHLQKFTKKVGPSGQIEVFDGFNSKYMGICILVLKLGE